MHWELLLLESILAILFLKSDWKQRAISVYLFIPSALLAFIHFITSDFTLVDLGFNCGFIVFNLMVISLFVLYKTNDIHQFQSFIGFGDILLWLILTLHFTAITYCIFFVGSLLLSLIIFKLFCKNNPSIPLAGLQYSLFVCFYLLETFSFGFNVDEFFIGFIQSF